MCLIARGKKMDFVPIVNSLIIVTESNNWINPEFIGFVNIARY
jgi:hypothetical protein